MASISAFFVALVSIPVPIFLCVIGVGGIGVAAFALYVVLKLGAK